MESDPRLWIATLRESHVRLTFLVEPMAPEQLRGRSYCRDWTIAQVLSHLGSGAEIALMMLPVALGQVEPLGQDAFRPIWDTWNAKDPVDQAADCLAANEKHIRALEELTDAELAGISFPFLGMDLDSVGLIRLRLGEHALHTWDVEVSSDPDATVSSGAVSLLIDNVPRFLAPRLGKPQGEHFRDRIRTSSPDRDYLLSVTDAVAMTDWPGDDGAGASEISMPAEALLRLSYGRLDADHTPADVLADPADLDRLRAVFPGF